MNHIRKMLLTLLWKELYFIIQPDDLAFLIGKAQASVYSRALCLARAFSSQIDKLSKKSTPINERSPVLSC